LSRQSGTRRFVAVSIAAALTTSCAVGPKYVRPAIEPPSGFKSAAPTGDLAELRADWWQLYRDPELERLVLSATDANQTLREAVARVDQARALARVAASYRYPTLSVSGIYTRQRTSATRASPTTGQQVSGSATYSDWLVPVDLTYELDVWGRVRQSVQAARAAVLATTDDEAVIRLAVQTDVAQDYYALRGFDSQSAVLRDTVAGYREQVRVLTVQVNTGLAGPLVLQQAQAQLQATVAQQTDIDRARADEEHALAILCGQPAASFTVAANAFQAVAPPAVPPGLPASLLVNRPDVAEAEQNIVAANAQVGVATANLRPTFALTGAAGFEAGFVQSLFDWQSALWSLAGGVTAPIFQGGRLHANLDAAKAHYQQTVAAYVNQVLVAYGDVEDALTDLHAITDEVASLRQAVAASEEYFRVAQVQYRNGLVDYLTVIDAERTLLSNQLALARSLTIEMSASVHLIKSIGGGWHDPAGSSAVASAPIDSTARAIP
jgi:multidrug efflux system outer membrane protein